jgi:pilus assembly protein CpaE
MTLPLLAGRAELAPAFLAVVGDAVTRETVRDAAARFGWTKAPVREGGVAAACQALRDAPAPALLVVDVSDSDDVLAAMDSLAEVCEPHTRVIALGLANDVTLYRDLIRIGVSDYLVKPVTAEALGEAFHRAERRQSAEPAPSKPARVVALVGARGGVGATSLALSVAWEAAHENQQRTVLIDLDLQFGAAALALDLEPGRGLREILANPERIDSLLLGSAMAHQSEKLRVLGAEESLEDDVEVAPRALQALLSAISDEADLIVIDVPRRADRLSREALARADAVVVVTDLSLPGMRDTQRLLGLLKTLRPQGGIAVAANRTGSGAGEVPQPEFERAIGTTLNVRVPFDVKAAAAAAEQAKPLVAASRTAPAAEELRRLAVIVVGEVPTAAPEPEKGSWVQRLLRR